MAELRHLYASEADFGRKRDRLGWVAFFGQAACVIGLLDGLLMIGLGHIAPGIGLMAMSIALFTLVYFGHWIATALLKPRPPSGSD